MVAPRVDLVGVACRQGDVRCLYLVLDFCDSPLGFPTLQFVSAPCEFLLLCLALLYPISFYMALSW